MTPSDYIENIKWTATHFDEVARGAILQVGIDHFKERFAESFNDSRTAKGKDIAGVEFFTSGQYRKDFRFSRGHTDTLNLSNREGNATSFRKAIQFEDKGEEFFINSFAQYKGEDYGDKVVDNFLKNGIDIFEFQTKDEAEQDLFRGKFIELMEFDF